MRQILHRLRMIIICICKCIVCIIPKNKKLILFSSWNGMRYADNPMYQYEYMLKNCEYMVCWYTRNRELYRRLKREGKPVVYEKSIKGMWYQARAIMLVSSIQFGDFNPYLLGKCIYFDLGHGFAIKDSGFEQKDVNKNFVDYVTTLKKGIRFYGIASSATSEFIKELALKKTTFGLSVDQIAICVPPRIDVFFDDELRRNNNTSIETFIKGKTVISYLPTHRSMGKKKINCHEIMNLENIQKLCEEHNAVFLVKKHSAHKDELEDFSMFNNIRDITGEDIETQTLLFQTDVLITDFSACMVDYSVLDRPMVFFAYDLKEFVEEERKLYVPFGSDNAGYIAETSVELDVALGNVLSDKEDLGHRHGRKLIRQRYFGDIQNFGDSRKRISKIIDEMIDGEYKNEWQ